MCFKVYSDAKVTFSDAKAKCENDGATVASVQNGFEQALIETLMMDDEKIDSYVWIGLYKDMVSVCIFTRKRGQKYPHTRHC